MTAVPEQVPRPDQVYTPPPGAIYATSGDVFKGRQVIVFGNSPGAGIFVYTGTPALGNPPVLSIVAPGVTQDPYGNPVTSVLGVQGSDGVVSIKDPAFIEFPSGNAAEKASAELVAEVQGSSPSESIQLFIVGAQAQGAGADDFVFMNLLSAAADGSSRAGMQFVYNDLSNVPLEYAFMNDQGFNIVAGNAAGQLPGTSPAQIAGWQIQAVGGSPAWSGDLFYIKCLENNVLLYGTLTAPGTTPVNNNVLYTLPSGYQPSAQISFGITSSSGTNATMTVATNGQIHTNGVTSPSSTVTVGPVLIPLGS